MKFSVAAFALLSLSSTSNAAYEGPYQIKSRVTGRCLRAPTLGNDAIIGPSGCNQNDHNQLFYYDSGGLGHYLRLFSSHGQCIDGNARHGLIVYQCTDLPHHKWRYEQGSVLNSGEGYCTNENGNGYNYHTPCLGNAAEKFDLISPTKSPTPSPTDVGDCIPDPMTCGCANVLQRDYRGTTHVTVHGVGCLNWAEAYTANTSRKNIDAIYPHEPGNSHGNYCRGDLDGTTKAWCYTPASNNGGRDGWDLCDVPNCPIVTAPPTPSPTTKTPTASPTSASSEAPTALPTKGPTALPTNTPTSPPTTSPPSTAPTKRCQTSLEGLASTYTMEFDGDVSACSDEDLVEAIKSGLDALGKDECEFLLESVIVKKRVGKTQRKLLVGSKSQAVFRVNSKQPSGTKPIDVASESGTFLAAVNKAITSKGATGSATSVNGKESNTGKGVNAIAKGDPHFKTFGGEQFDFHGGCDLVFLQHAGFSNGLGMDIHIRTKINTWWSYIHTAVVRIGDVALEITGGIDGGKYWVNGVARKSLDTFMISGFMVKMTQVSKKQKKYRIELGHGNAIAIETYKDFVSTNVKVDTGSEFMGSHGLMGTYPNGEKVARDGMTTMQDPIVFGKEWQVLASEGMLFHSVEGPQHPQSCAMPDTTEASVSRKNRRLGEGATSKADAEAACARAEPEEQRSCIFDVLATQDTAMAGAY